MCRVPCRGLGQYGLHRPSGLRLDHLADILKFPKIKYCHFRFLFQTAIAIPQLTNEDQHVQILNYLTKGFVVRSI